jgi:hypothetical protein
VRALLARDETTRDHAHDQGRRIDVAQKDWVALYKELEEPLRQRDQARAKQKSRDRGERGHDQ